MEGASAIHTACQDVPTLWGDSTLWRLGGTGGVGTVSRDAESNRRGGQGQATSRRPTPCALDLMGAERPPPPGKSPLQVASEGREDGYSALGGRPGGAEWDPSGLR